MKQIVKGKIEVKASFTEKELREYHFYRGVCAGSFAFGFSFLCWSFVVFPFSFKLVSLICFTTWMVAFILQNRKMKGGK